LARGSLGLLVSLVFVLPLWWAFVASHGATGAPPASRIQWWPAEARWENYGRVFEIVPMARYTRNSLIVTGLAVPLTIITSSLAGFAMFQFPPAVRTRLVRGSIVLMLIPGAAVWLFRFQLLSWLGWLDTLMALIFPAFAGSSPLFVLLFYWNFRRIPEDAFEAARLDGAGAGTIWWRLALPLARPTVIGVVVLSFVFYWSDFISPILYVFNPQLYTLPIGLQLLNQFGADNWPVLMAGSVLISLPVIILFVILQKSFLNDLSLAELFDRAE
jgi:multiple sugar transport system permease protein